MPDSARFRVGHSLRPRSGQPAVALAAKLASRTACAGLPVDLLPTPDGPGAGLFRLAAAAQLDGDDPEALLRSVCRRFAAARTTGTASDRAAHQP